MNANQFTSSANVESTVEASAPQHGAANAFRIFAGLLLLGTIGLVGMLWVRGSGPVDIPELNEPLPVIAAVPEFSLTASDGRNITRGDLLGSVWVADFIYTTCTGPCPTMTLRMRSLQEEFRPLAQEVKLVSFSLDPTNDTPAVLQAYAKKNYADPARWWFITGTDEKQVHEMVRNGFLQTVQRAPGMSIVHSAYYLVMDRQGRIRGAYDGMDLQSIPKIVAAVHSLVSEKSGP